MAAIVVVVTMMLNTGTATVCVFLHTFLRFIMYLMAADFVVVSC